MLGSTGWRFVSRRYKPLMGQVAGPPRAMFMARLLVTKARKTLCWMRRRR